MVFYLQRRFENQLQQCEIIQKEDLNLVNHLSGKQGRFVKLSFKNVQDLQDVKSTLAPIVERNKVQQEAYEAYEGWMNPDELADGRNKTSQIEKKILAIREYDVAYHIRTMVDSEIRCS
jgi:DNA polymerase epsilon subunit 1